MSICSKKKRSIKKERKLIQLKQGREEEAESLLMATHHLLDFAKKKVGSQKGKAALN